MRRWNGWGDDQTSYPLPAAALRFLEERIGAGELPCDVTLEKVLAAVPNSRLPAHPLVITDAIERLRHARGQSLPDWLALRSGRIGAFPDGVAFPSTDGEACDLLKFAEAHSLQVIPFGGGTSVVGHVNPVCGGAPTFTIDMSRMSSLRQWDDVNKLATFGAGIAGPNLEAELRARNCTLGHFPQSFEYSTLGGWIATRSSGQQSLGYGRIERLFAGGRMISPAGTLDLPTFPASAAGPDLREMVLGSEGRFGIITEATVRATPLPAREEFHAVFFPDFEHAIDGMRAIAQERLPLSMLRLSTAEETETTLALAGHEKLIAALEWLLAKRHVKDGKCMALLGFTGGEAIVRVARGQAIGIAKSFGAVHIGTQFGKQWQKGRFRTPYLRNALWEAGYAVDTLETATDWINVPRLLEAIEIALGGALTESGERTHVFTHLSHLYPTGSSLYTTYLFRAAEMPEETLRRWRLLKEAASNAIVACGGTITHHHGVGTDHRPYLVAEKGALGIEAIAAICRQFDPKGIMNPGKLIG